MTHSASTQRAANGYLPGARRGGYGSDSDGEARFSIYTDNDGGGITTENEGAPTDDGGTPAAAAAKDDPEGGYVSTASSLSRASRRSSGGILRPSSYGVPRTKASVGRATTTT